MRWDPAIAALLLGLSVAYADEGGPSPNTTGLTEEEIEQGFVSLFDGKTLRGWQGWLGGLDDYVVENGVLIYKEGGSKGNLYTIKEYSDFIFRFEFKLVPGGNHGVGIRAPLKARPHLAGMEIQILDDYAPRWAHLKPCQYHGSIYCCVPAKRGHLKPAGQWNSEEIMCQGSRVRVTLNGAVILDVDLDTLGDKRPSGEPYPPGLKRRKGHVGFDGYGIRTEFRNIRIKDLSKGDAGRPP
ncbi:MAG TPA: DUF1080 domain-containing protein [Planctomycetes bacterium]|nr:DUF1080 domain-containing protein [Planctomycetota bacterium]